MPVWACLNWEELFKSPSLSFHNEINKLSDCVAKRKKHKKQVQIALLILRYRIPFFILEILFHFFADR